MIQLQHLPPLSLYIHIPWCVRKCPYCDFNSHEVRGEIPQQAYIEMLLFDLEQTLPLVWGRQLQSIFIGGGTPSLLPAELIDLLLCRIRALLPLTYDAEITLEANPGTVEADKFADFCAAGINRISLGIQSFDDKYLRALGRIHDGKEARRAVEVALDIFDNVNLDLMYALPDQSLEHALNDIRTAIFYEPCHISAYHLTIEANTAFYHQPPTVADDDTSIEMQEMIESELAKAGYNHYETSAFSKIGKQCRHNLNYWLFGDYLGIGAGAHGKLSSANHILRQARVKHPAVYLSKVNDNQHINKEYTLTTRDLAFEFMMNALRLVDGFPITLFSERTGLSISSLDCVLQEAQQKGLIIRSQDLIKPTILGQRYLNDLLQMFL